VAFESISLVQNERANTHMANDPWPAERKPGPVTAVPKLLESASLTVDDIGLWEVNEAFAVQSMYCRDRLGIPEDRMNVDGRAISVGTPMG
jgi:acetyl-CoA C-acetyltransferase